MNIDFVTQSTGYLYWKNLKGVYIACNQICAEFWGFNSPAEMVGKTDRELLLDRAGEDVVKMLEDIDREVMTKGIERIIYEIAPDAQGITWSFLTHKAPLRDENNTIIGLMGNSINYSDLANMQTDIINYSMGNLFWKDRDGRFLGSNKAFANAVGFSSPEQLIGKTDYDLNYPDPALPEKVILMDKEVIRAEKEIVREEVGTDLKGNLKTFLSKKGPLRDRWGNIIGVIGTSLDITDQKRAERIKTEFLENMRHDIRTPLSGIIGFAQLIKDEASDSKISEYADNMIASSQTLMNLLNDILEIIEITSGRVPHSRKRFNLKNLIQSILDLEVAKIKSENIMTQLDYDSNIPHNLLGDERRVHRILFELINNAVKFTHNGKIDIKTELLKKTSRKCLIKITVTDTGIGIPEEKLDEIFSQFTRLTPSHEGIYRGVGLGLTAVKQYIQDMDGEITVSSTLKKGSVFTVVLPLKESLATDKKLDLISGNNTEINFITANSPELNNTKKTSVLLVEDQAISANVAQELLKNINCEVDWVTTAQAAILQSKAKKYDLILMDIGLPDTPGDQATREIRAWEQKLEEYTPIIALTAHASTEKKQEFIKLGMDAVFAKPLMKETAIDILAAFVYKTRSMNIKVRKPKTNNKIIDLDLGATLVGKDHAFAKDMISTLINTFGEELNTMGIAYDQGNWSKIADIAHRIKGATSYCGTPRLHKAAAVLQKYLQGEEIQNREPLYQNLLSEIEAVKQAYNNL